MFLDKDLDISLVPNVKASGTIGCDVYETRTIEKKKIFGRRCRRLNRSTFVFEATSFEVKYMYLIDLAK